MINELDLEKIDWAKSDGLVPAVVQDVRNGCVLMLGYVNREALEASRQSGLMTFYSRSKQRLWQKGETSGHVLRIEKIRLDCDADTVLVLALPEGPTCHNGTQSCFGDDDPPPFAVLAELAATIKHRRQNSQSGSYTAKLFAAGIPRIAQKVGEEGVEVALAAAAGGAKLAEETADLVYHLSVLLEASDLNWKDVMNVLQSRAGGKK
ncbi:MAG: bifunctional phosphoribosyl-AMP cyclohydrolase/phosphoribosyl-ATP diphosphatase HisIE [Bdellovibrionales bacterium]